MRTISILASLMAAIYGYTANDKALMVLGIGLGVIAVLIGIMMLLQRIFVIMMISNRRDLECEGLVRVEEES